MLLGRAAQLIVIIASSFLQPSEISAQTIIQGDCNVVSSPENRLGNVSYKITCNNISAGAGEQIERVLELIEQLSKESSNAELSEILSSLLAKSEATIEELRKARSPKIVLSRRNFPICDKCGNFVDFQNVGGSIQRIDEFSVREIVTVWVYDGTVSTIEGDVLCPFRNSRPFESASITMDYSSGGFSLWGREDFPEGHVIAQMEFSNRHQGHLRFIDSVLENYNTQRQRRLGNTVSTELLSSCIGYRFEIGIKIALRSYNGGAYEQYFVFEYDIIDTEIVLKDSLFRQGSRGFDELAAKYDQAANSRQNKGTVGEIINYGMIAKFLLENSR